MTNVFAMRENRYTPFRIQGDTYHAQLEIPASLFDNVEKMTTLLKIYIIVKKRRIDRQWITQKKTTYNNNDTKTEPNSEGYLLQISKYVKKMKQ